MPGKIHPDALVKANQRCCYRVPGVPVQNLLIRVLDDPLPAAHYSVIGSLHGDDILRIKVETIPARFDQRLKSAYL